MSAARWNRKIHRWGAIALALPLLVIIATGVLLQLKKESDWIQPPTQKGVGGPPEIAFERILDAARSARVAGISTWDDVARLDVRPSRGIVKVRAKNGHEVQVDTKTGDVLQIAVRRSDVIESIHDGSFVHDKVKLWVFLPAAGVLAILWGTGLYLWLLPHLNRRKRRSAS